MQSNTGSGIPFLTLHHFLTDPEKASKLLFSQLHFDGSRFKISIPVFFKMSLTLSIFDRY